MGNECNSSAGIPTLGGIMRMFSTFFPPLFIAISLYLSLYTAYSILFLMRLPSNRSDVSLRLISAELAAWAGSDPISSAASTDPGPPAVPGEVAGPGNSS